MSSFQRVIVSWAFLILAAGFDVAIWINRVGDKNLKGVCAIGFLISLVFAIYTFESGGKRGAR